VQSCSLRGRRGNGGPPDLNTHAHTYSATRAHTDPVVRIAGAAANARRLKGVETSCADRLPHRARIHCGTPAHKHARTHAQCDSVRVHISRVRRVHTHTHTHTHARTHTHTRTPTHTHMHARTHARTHTCARAHTHVRACTCVCGCICQRESVCARESVCMSVSRLKTLMSRSVGR
jgi:hypothetical protein